VESTHSWEHLNLFFFLYLFAVLGFELRALGLPGRGSRTCPASQEHLAPGALLAFCSFAFFVIYLHDSKGANQEHFCFSGVSVQDFQETGCTPVWLVFDGRNN
jgi:hypothetical protein